MSTDESSVQEGREANAPTGSVKSRGSRVPLIALLLVGAVLAIWFITLVRRPSASALFRWYVVDPIPASVTDIKVDQPMSGDGFGYVFRFAARPADIEHICKSRSLRKILGGGGYDGVLSFSLVFGDAPSIAYSFEPYRRDQRRPSWFDVATWKNPEGYALVQVDWSNLYDMQVLIYNRELGQAYFMVFDYRGTMPDFSLFGKYRKGGMYIWNEDKP